MPSYIFGKNKKKREIDILIEHGDTLTPVEIKAGTTITDDYFRHLRYWKKLAGNTGEAAYLVYAGKDSAQRADAQVLSWAQLDLLSLV